MSSKRVRGEQLYMFMQIAESWKPVGCSTDCSLNISADAVEISQKGQGSWRCFRIGQKQWSMDCAGFYFDGDLPTNMIAGSQMVGQKISVAMTLLDEAVVNIGLNLDTVQPNATHTITGEAIIVSCDYAGSRGGLATYKISMQGSGELKPMS